MCILKDGARANVMHHRFLEEFFQSLQRFFVSTLLETEAGETQVWLAKLWVGTSAKPTTVLISMRSRYIGYDKIY
jgi:hypothetical protein